MKNGFRFSAFALIAVLAFAGTLSAQLDLNGPNAALRVNNKVPSGENAQHDVLIAVPSQFNLEIESGANPATPLILLASGVDPVGPVFGGLPWGGSIDLGILNGMGNGVIGVTALGDGIGLSVNPLTDIFFATDSGDPANGIAPAFNLSYTAGAGLSGARVAFQAIVQDPLNPLFPLDNTEVGDANFNFGQVVNVQTGDDGVIQQSFLPGNSFNFHGINYIDCHISGNGHVNFGGPSTLGLSGFDNDNVGWVNDVPAIAGLLCDWTPNGNGPTDGVLFEEINNQLRISWGDPSVSSGGGIPHFADNDVNCFDVRMVLDNGVDPNQGNFRMIQKTLDPNAAGEFGNGLIGHTPGGLAIVGTTVDENLRSVPAISAAGGAQIEEHDFAGTNFSNHGFDGLGTTRNYNDITTHWNGADVSVVPNGFTIAPGDNGYVTMPSAVPAPDSVARLSLGTLNGAGGETVTAYGSFAGFDPNGDGSATVVFDPNGLFGGPFAAGVSGILDDSFSQPLSLPNPAPSPDRDLQALIFVTQAFTSSGVHQVQFTFDSGVVVNRSIFVLAPGGAFTSFTLPDDGFATHTLTVPIAWYGTIYNSITLNSNGYLSFVTGSGDFTETEAKFFNGWGVPPNPGVGCFYSDLNSGGAGSGATYDVAEDPGLQTVIVIFNNQNHWSSVEPAGTFTATFGSIGPNSVTQNYDGFLPGATSGDDGIIGVTDGDQSVGIDTSLSNGLGTGITSQLGIFASAGAGDSICETIPANMAIGGGATQAPLTINWLDVGGNGTWTFF